MCVYKSALYLCCVRIHIEYGRKRDRHSEGKLKDALEEEKKKIEYTTRTIMVTQMNWIRWLRYMFYTRRKRNRCNALESSRFSTIFTLLIHIHTHTYTAKQSKTKQSVLLFVYLLFDVYVCIKTLNLTMRRWCCRHHRITFRISNE